MHPPPKPSPYRSSIFIWLAAGTLFILLIPLVTMQFSSELSWSALDFLVMGALLYGFSSGFVLLYRWLPQNRKLLAGVAFVVGFVYLWAELAVGIFTDLAG